MAYRALTKDSCDALYGRHETGVHPQFFARLNDADTDLLAGSVVHLNSDLEFAAGVGSDRVMPLFLISRPGEPDGVMDAPDPAVDVDAWVGMASPGRQLAFPANGGFEISSTAYVDGDYPPNTLLTAAKTGAAKGQLVQGTAGTDTLCGIVSRGVVDNGAGYPALAFWSIVDLHS